MIFIRFKGILMVSCLAGGVLAAGVWRLEDREVAVEELATSSKSYLIYYRDVYVYL